MTASDYSEFDEELKAFEFAGKDGLLASEFIKYFKDQ